MVYILFLWMDGCVDVWKVEFWGKGLRIAEEVGPECPISFRDLGCVSQKVNWLIC